MFFSFWLLVDSCWLMVGVLLFYRYKAICNKQQRPRAIAAICRCEPVNTAIAIKCTMAAFVCLWCAPVAGCSFALSNKNKQKQKKSEVMKNIIITLFLAVCTAFSLSACHKDDGSTPSKTFVLVHGAWQAPYAWQYVKAGLEQKGQKVIVVELPAHGSDATPPQNVSIDAYRDKVIAAINGVNGKVILVGHSMGGMVVSAVAEKIPGKIEKLVFVGAFVPANGQSLQDLAGQDAQSLLGPALIPSQDQLTLDIKTESRINIFCQDASDAVKALVANNFRAEPAIPFTNAATITDANFGSVDKYYVHTLQDHAVGIDLQRKMVSAAHITKTYSLNSGHCPFLSMPGDMTDILMQVIK